MAAERKSGDLGAKLREARERRGTSLRDIANETKISVTVLEALERNDVSRLPGGIFSRGFVRSYAAQIGLNPEEAVEEFLRQFPPEHAAAGQTQHATHAPLPAHDVSGDSFESDRRTASAILTLLAISVPLAAAVIYLGASGRAPWADNTSSAPLPPVTTAQPAKTVDPVGAIDATAPVHVEFTAVRTCVVTVVIDGQPSQEVAMPAAARRSFDVRREMTLTVSDGAAIVWTLNGAPARPPGAAGGPVSLTLTAERYRDFLDTR